VARKNSVSIIVLLSHIWVTAPLGDVGVYQAWRWSATCVVRHLFGFRM